VYLDVLKDGVLPDAGVLYDLGCGQGLMLSLLGAARDRYPSGEWPAGWPAPPSALELRGIELRPRVAKRTRELLQDLATIETLDLSEASLPRCEAVLLLDVLHLMAADKQDRLLEGVARALTPGGVLVLREADASGGWRFRMVRLGNRLRALGPRSSSRSASRSRGSRPTAAVRSRISSSTLASATRPAVSPAPDLVRAAAVSFARTIQSE
jgi:SAM-dependent methyltransferase